MFCLIVIYLICFSYFYGIRVVYSLLKGIGLCMFFIL